MSIMQQSSKAQDRTMGVWFQAIQQGQVKLPRFQRYEAWDRGRITSFLNTIINNLPVGVTVALDGAGAEKLISRYIVSADPAMPGTVTQHLISFGLLDKAHYQGLDGEALKTKLEADFREFMRDRAKLVHKAVVRLAAGEQPSLDSIWATSSVEPAVMAQQEASI